MNNVEEQISEYLIPFPAHICRLAMELRAYLKEQTNPATELVGDSTISLNIGYGFTEKAWDCFCAIIVYTKHINISLPSGAFLNDPDGLLHGTGKRVRHIKINDLNDLRTPAAQKILAQARNLALEKLEDPVDHKGGIKTIIKPIAGIKKRPARRITKPKP